MWRWFAVALVVGCGAKADDSAAGADPCARRPALEWDNFGKGLMDKHCNGCHSSLVDRDARKGAPIGVDFNTYAGVLEFSDRIGARSLGDTPTMPPGGGPDLEERARLEEWLQCEVAADRAALAEQR
jgi:uncharacterized membrane protein